MARPPKYNWDKIKLDYESGLSQAEIHHKHEVPYNRLSERVKEWTVSEQARAVIKGFDEVSEVITELKGTNPDLARNVIDIVADKHPQFKKAMVALSSKLFNRMLSIADNATASEIPQIAKGMQIVTDTLGVSQRHASTTINNTNAVQNEAPTVVFQRIGNPTNN
jgi:hypothetical protein